MQKLALNLAALDLDDLAAGADDHFVQLLEGLQRGVDRASQIVPSGKSRLNLPTKCSMAFITGAAFTCILIPATYFLQSGLQIPHGAASGLTAI